MALHYHPDKHAASECDIWTTQLQILNSIPGTLINKEERHKYDRQSGRASRIAARDALRDVGRASSPPQHRDLGRYNAREHSATKAVIDHHLETIARLFREGKALEEDVANMQSFVDVYDKLPPRPDGLQEGEHWDSSVDPLVALGQPVGKRFGGIDYAGYIVGYESHRHRSGHYWVRYQDEDLISFPERELNVDLNYYVHMQNHDVPPPQHAQAHGPANALFSDLNPDPNTYADTVLKAGGFEFLAQLYQDQRLFELRDHRLPTSARAVRATTCLCVNTTKLVLSLCPLFPEGSKEREILRQFIHFLPQLLHAHGVRHSDIESSSHMLAQGKWRPVWKLALAQAARLEAKRAAKPLTARPRSSEEKAGYAVKCALQRRNATPVSVICTNGH